MAGRVKRSAAPSPIELELALGRLDREWMHERGRYLSGEGEGARPPQRWAVAFASGMVAAIGLVWGLGHQLFEAQVDPQLRPFLPLIAAGWYVLAALVAAFGMRAVRRYERAERRYQAKRRALLRQLEG